MTDIYPRRGVSICEIGVEPVLGPKKAPPCDVFKFVRLSPDERSSLVRPALEPHDRLDRAQRLKAAGAGHAGRTESTSAGRLKHPRGMGRHSDTKPLKVSVCGLLSICIYVSGGMIHF